MPKSPNKVQTDTATIYVDKDGIIVIEMNDGVTVDEIDALNNNLAIRHVSKNQPALKLVDSRNSWSMTSKAKKASAEYNKRGKTIARAIVVSNSIKSAFYSFLATFNTKKSPQKIFTDMDEAREWLLSFRK